MIVQRNPLTLVRVALASALIGVLGCSEEPIQQPVSAKQNAPENPPKLSPPPPPKRAVSETQLALPEYYGFYAIADGKTTEIKASPTEAPEFTANVEFLAFDKAVATGLANLPTLHRLSLKPPPANQTDDGSFKGWDDFFQKSQVDAPKQWAEARSGIPGDAIAIELRTKPVKDQPEMIRMVPAKVLEPGLYLLRRITYVWIDRSVYISGRIASARLAFQSDDFQSASFHAGIVLSIEPMNAEAKSLLAESADRFGRRERSIGGVTIGDRVLAFGPSAVRKLTVGPAGATPDILERADSAGGEWLLRLGGPAASPIAWPVPGAQADNLLAIMAESRAVALPEKGGELGQTPTEVTIERADGGPITLRLAERTIGGMGLVEITTRGDGPKTVVTRAVVDDRLHQLLRDRNVRIWRDRTAMPWARGEVSRVRLESSNKALYLGRLEGRWSLREPVASPADNAAVQQMLATLAGVEVTEFIDDGAPGIATGLDKPSARVLVEIDRLENKPGADKPTVETIHHTLDIGGRADAAGERLFAVIDGDRIVKINASGLAKLSLDPSTYLSPFPTSVTPASVGMMVLDRLDQQGVPTEDGRILKRSMERWVDHGQMEGVAPKALTDEEVKDIGAALAFLSADSAAGETKPEVRLDAPEGYRAGARISLRSLDDAPLTEVEVGMSTVSALAAVRTGNVYRVYPLDRLPRLIARVMAASPAINPPAPAGSEAVEPNK